MLVLGLCAAGFCGALTRFFLGGLITAKAQSDFPWGTFIINVSGAFLLGLVSGGTFFPSSVRVVIGTGFLGAYTTFSTLNLETVRLVQAGYYRAAVANVMGSMVTGLLAAALGLHVGGTL